MHIDSNGFELNKLKTKIIVTMEILENYVKSPVSNVKKDSLVYRVRNGKPTKKAYFMVGFNRSTRKYELQSEEDFCEYVELSSTKEVYVASSDLKVDFTKANEIPKQILGSGNSKLKATEKELNVKIFNFSIPAGNDKLSGKLTCPFAKECLKFCYATKGAYIWSNTELAMTQRYNASKLAHFDSLVIDFLTKKLKREKRQIYVRVHDSGDFYSKNYLESWLNIARSLPNVRFYAYTKSHSIVRNLEERYGAISAVPNFDFIYSLGSTNDQLIDLDTERHSKIFKSKEELLKNGYVDASKTDLHATKWFNESNKVGLILH